MTDRDLLVFLVLVTVSAIIGTVEWIIEVTEPGANAITAATVLAVGWIMYRIGKGSGNGKA